MAETRPCGVTPIVSLSYAPTSYNTTVLFDNNPFIYDTRTNNVVFLFLILLLYIVGEITYTYPLANYEIGTYRCYCTTKLTGSIIRPKYNYGTVTMKEAVGRCVRHMLRWTSQRARRLIIIAFQWAPKPILYIYQDGDGRVVKAYTHHRRVRNIFFLNIYIIYIYIFIFQTYIVTYGRGWEGEINVENWNSDNHGHIFKNKTI